MTSKQRVVEVCAGAGATQSTLPQLANNKLNHLRCMIRLPAPLRYENISQ
jgi:hypothetical protein